MRLFVALDVRGDIGEQLFAWQRRLQQTPAQVRWVRPDQYHITVKFIGLAETAQLDPICRRLDQAAAQVPAFPLVIQGLSRLESRGKVRIIMAEIGSPGRRITRLHRLIDQEMGALGFDLDTRPLRPHLTLGRVRSNHSLNKLLRRLEHYNADRMDPLGPWWISEALLMESIPSPEGTSYRRLHRAPLPPAAPSDPANHHA